MSKSVLLILVLAILVSSLVTACCPPPFECTDAIGCVDIPPGEPIKLGVIQALSGGVAPGGIIQARTIELAVTQRDMQLLGHPIVLQKENEYCSSEGGATAALKIAADPQTVGIIGTSCSGAAVPAAQIMSEAGLVMVSGLNTAPSLTSIGGTRGANWQPGYFRTIYNGMQMAHAAAQFAFYELGIAKVATIDDGDAYTHELASEFNRVFIELGGEVTLSARVNRGDTNMKPVLAAVAASEAELIYLPLFQSEADHIVRQAQDVTGLQDVTLLGGETLGSEQFIESVGVYGIGMYFTSTAFPTGDAYGKLVSDYEARYGEQPQHHAYAYAYDAANLLLNAIETIAEQETDGTLHIGRSALREALYTMTDFEGVTGRLACDEFGDCGSVGLVVLCLDDPSGGLDGLRSNVVYTYTPER
jgi:branched-chain amino acid transport system substrate-binding protein